jgi:type VI secretion system protein ImpK
MDRILEVSKNCFNAIIQLRRADPSGLPPPETVRSKISGYIDTFLQQAAQAGYLQTDCQDISYALVALADEVAIGKSESFRQAWLGQLLALQYFQDNTAGTGFFSRLENIRRDPQRMDVLRIYYYCLLLGFQGRYKSSNEMQLVSLTEGIQQQLSNAYKTPETLSPKVKTPAKILQKSQRSTFLLVATGVLIFATLIYSGLRLSLSVQTRDVVRQISGGLR